MEELSLKGRFSMEKMLCSVTISPAQAEALRHAWPGLSVSVKPEPWDAADLLDADFLMGYPAPSLLEQQNHIRLLQLTASGSELYTGRALPFPIASAAGAYGNIVSEYVLAALLSFYHNLHRYRNQQSRHFWGFCGPNSGISGKNVLILGTGDIGCHLARKLRALGACPIGLTRSSCSHPEVFQALHPSSRLDDWLPQADAVVLCIPGSPENRGLFSYERLCRMRQDAVLINVGRGNLVDTDGLCRCLGEGRLGGAILDVTEPEPLPRDHPLWEVENVILTPHCAGSFRDMPPELIQAIVDIACENLSRLRQGLPLRGQVRR